jgi:hypothetical protein
MRVCVCLCLCVCVCILRVCQRGRAPTVCAALDRPHRVDAAGVARAQEDAVAGLGVQRLERDGRDAMRPPWPRRQLLLQRRRYMLRQPLGHVTVRCP